ncbi:hypothetical protein F1880_009887 [Penicillium rolfsii]|nr:hypothetical protein F1880_009887 [Penicillium rolfsii]
MARVTTAVKSRKAPNTEAISFPVLTYANALPRDDLRDIKNNGSGQLPEHGQAAKYDLPRPKHRDGQGSMKPLPDVAMAASFDFRVTAPPDEVFPSGASANGSPGGIPRIGVALGSPSMLDSQDNLPPPRFKADIFAQEEAGLPPLPRKPSKWKKIGGLFKAKHALAMPMDEQPKISLEKPAPKQKTEQNGKPPQRRGSIEEWPVIEVDSPAAVPAGTNSSPQRTRKLSLPGKKTNKPLAPDKGGKSLLLEIDIPDVQMERYSVMFSQVMKKNQRPSLLARRSKTLDNLRVPNNQDFMAAKIPPVPQRRATSPAQSSFTLFPASQPSKAAQDLATPQNFSRGPSPLLRSNTLPIESPSKTSMELRGAMPHINVASPFESPTPIQPIPALRPRPSKLPISQTPKPTYQERKSSLQAPRVHTQPQVQAPPKAHLTPQKAPTSVQDMEHRPLQRPNERPPRPKLKIETKQQPPPRPPVKKGSSSSTLPTSTPPTSTLPTPNLSKDNLYRTPSPIIRSLSPRSGISPGGSSPRMPFVSEPEEIDIEVGMALESKEPPESLQKIPTIEVSIARSISVSRGKRQMIVPIGARADHLHSNERLIERRPMTPRITDVSYGHKHAVSQELQIESL